MSDFGTWLDFCAKEIKEKEEEFNMKKREKERALKRWGWERIVEALNGLRLTEWPFDDLNEFEDIEVDERPEHLEALDSCIKFLHTYIKRG